MVGCRVCFGDGYDRQHISGACGTKSELVHLREENPNRTPPVFEPVNTAMKTIKNFRVSYNPSDRSLPLYQKAKADALCEGVSNHGFHRARQLPLGTLGEPPSEAIQHLVL